MASSRKHADHTRRPAREVTVAAHNLNFHLEHHLLPTALQDSLARMHIDLMLQRGALDPRSVALSELGTLGSVTRRYNL